MRDDDDRQPGGQPRGVTASGRLRVLRARYLTDAGLAEPRLGGVIRTSDDVTLVLEPTRWSAWGMNAAHGDVIGNDAYTRPLDLSLGPG